MAFHFLYLFKKNQSNNNMNKISHNFFCSDLNQIIKQLLQSVGNTVNKIYTSGHMVIGLREILLFHQ